MIEYKRGNICVSYSINVSQQWVDNSSEALKNLKKKKSQQKAQAKAAKSSDNVVRYFPCDIDRE